MATSIQILKLLALIAALGMLETAYGERKFSAEKFLTHYGYLEKSTKNGRLMHEDTLTKAVEKYQNFYGLNVTGELDEATMEEMKKPRCGVSDKQSLMAPGPNSYVLLGSRWQNYDLTYTILNYPNTLQPSVVDAEIERAFATWSEVTDLKFTFQRQNQNSDFIIGFFQRHHNRCPFDGPFDGPSNILAHAFNPPIGEIHFDNDENWTKDGRGQGIDLFLVAVHEIGHALGLGHTPVETAIMYATYGYKQNFELTPDDIEGIQKLYGPKTGQRPTEKPRQPLGPNGCDCNGFGGYVVPGYGGYNVQPGNGGYNVQPGYVVYNVQPGYGGYNVVPGYGGYNGLQG